MIVGITAIGYLLRRKQKRGAAFGIGGSLILLGLILLAVVYGLISVSAVWVLTGSAVIILASSCYVAVRRTPAAR